MTLRTDEGRGEVVYQAKAALVNADFDVASFQGGGVETHIDWRLP